VVGRGLQHGVLIETVLELSDVGVRTIDVPTPLADFDDY
jgi:hypothetical protein